MAEVCEAELEQWLSDSLKEYPGVQQVGRLADLGGLYDMAGVTLHLQDGRDICIVIQQMTWRKRPEV